MRDGRVYFEHPAMTGKEVEDNETKNEDKPRQADCSAGDFY